MASASLGSTALAGAALVGLGISFAWSAWQGGAGSHNSSSTSSGTGKDLQFPSQHDPTVFREAKLVSSRQVGNAKLLRFRYEGGAPGFAPIKPLSHLIVRGKTMDVPPEYPFGLKVERAYTPISANKNEFELLVKEHKQTSTGKEFSKYGLTSKFLLALQTGQCVEVRGPMPSMYVETTASKGNAAAAAQAQAQAQQDLRDAVQQRKFVGMVAAGSGITPMIQLLKHTNPSEQRKFSLLWSNKTVEDTFYVKELERLKSRDVSIRQTLTRGTPVGWSQDTGRVSKELLRARMPPPGPECLIIVCGPDAFVQAVAGGRRDADGRWTGPVGGLLQELDYSSEHVIRL